MPMRSCELHDEARGDTRVLRFGGRLTTARVNDVARRLRALQPDGRPTIIDITGVERIDTTGAWLIYRLVRDWTKAGDSATLEGADADALKLIEQVGANDRPVKIRPDRTNPFVRRLAQIGDHVIDVVDTLGDFLGFLGETMRVLGRTSVSYTHLRAHET